MTPSAYRVTRRDELVHGPEPEDKPPPKKPSSLATPEEALRALERAIDKPNEKAVRIVSAGPKHFSTTLAGDLKRADLRSLLLHKVHWGSFLLLRVISDLTYSGTTMFAGQDPSGKATLVELYGPPTSLASGTAELQALMPKGSVILVREPYLEWMAVGATVARVYSPTDVERIRDEDRELPGLVWKKQAVDAVRPQPDIEAYQKLSEECAAKGWYLAAEKAINDGMSLKAASCVAVGDRLGREIIRRQQGLWRSALQDCQAVLALEKAQCAAPERQKALLDAAACQYALQLWGAAQTSFKQALAADPASAKAKRGLERVIERLHEAKTGNYHWPELYDASQKNPHVDLADYVSSAVRVADIKGKGRGIVANREIEPGELLMMVRPLASAYWDELGIAQKVGTANLHVGSYDAPTKTHLAQKLAMRVMEDVSVADALELLYAGPERSCPTSFSLNKLKPRPDVAPRRTNVDMERLDLLVTYNALQPRRLSTVMRESPDDVPGGKTDIDSRAPAAFYLVPSLLNHSCTPTAIIRFVGDALMIRATQYLEENEEVTYAYASGPFESRTEALLKRGVSACSCDLCEEDRKETLQGRNRRKFLLSLVKTAAPATSASAAPHAWETYYKLVERRVEDVRKTYSPKHDVGHREQLFVPYMYLADMCGDLAHAACTCPVHDTGDRFLERQKWADLAVEWATKALVCVGADVPDAYDGGDVSTCELYARHEHAVLAYLLVAGVLFFTGDYDEGVSWFEAAFTVDQICVGGGRDLFEKRYENELTSYCLEMDDLPSYF